MYETAVVPFTAILQKKLVTLSIQRLASLFYHVFLFGRITFLSVLFFINVKKYGITEYVIYQQEE